jgi:hypothetical protein
MKTLKAEQNLVDERHDFIIRLIYENYKVQKKNIVVSSILLCVIAICLLIAF